MATKKRTAKKATKPQERNVCGIVMPISAIADYSETHWAEIREILSDCIAEADFEPNLVSDADDSGLIHKRIIQNLYDNEIVVCDVSAKNPNVMFELGLRLAFDKPTIIVKDDKTSYSFDTSGIEHLEYPRDLRYQRMVEFQEKLTEKIRATHQRATSDSSYTTFLKHFGNFKTVKLESTEVSAQEFVLDELKVIRRDLRTLQSSLASDDDRRSYESLLIDIDVISRDRRAEALQYLKSLPGVMDVQQIGVTEFRATVRAKFGISVLREFTRMYGRAGRARARAATRSNALSPPRITS